MRLHLRVGAAFFDSPPVRLEPKDVESSPMKYRPPLCARLRTRLPPSSKAHFAPPPLLCVGKSFFCFHRWESRIALALFLPLPLATPFSAERIFGPLPVSEPLSLTTPPLCVVTPWKVFRFQGRYKSRVGGFQRRGRDNAFPRRAGLRPGDLVLSSTVDRSMFPERLRPLRAGKRLPGRSPTV